MTMVPTIDFNNATEYSEVYGGTLITPAQTSTASVHTTLSSTSTSTPPANASSDDPEYKPVVLKCCRHAADFRDLLHAFSKLRDVPQAPNLVVFIGAAREHPSASSSTLNSPRNETNSRNNHGSWSRRTSSFGLVTNTISTLSLSSNTTTPASPQRVAARDWIVTKPAAHGTLHEYLKSPQGKALDWMDKVRLIRGVASGLLHLHERGLLHMNLHSDNVLVEKGPTGPIAVLTDFGQISRSTRGPEPVTDPSSASLPVTSPKSGTRWIHSGGVYEKGLIYTAPERRANPELNPCTTASDIYSFGVIMLEILTGHRSLASQFLTSSSASTENSLQFRERAAAASGRSSPIPTLSTSQGTLALPAALESLIRKICSRDPAQRPGLLVIRSQLKEMANTSFDLHVREPISKGTTGIQLNAKKPISLISVVTTPSVIAESSTPTLENNGYSSRSLIEPLTPKSPNQIKKRTSILRKALDMSLNSPPASPKRKALHIWEAAAKGDTKSINSLLSQGISVNQRDPLTDHTPLIAAVTDIENPQQVPSIPALELLINRGAEINAFDQKTKQTILHHLCSRPNPPPPAVLQFLLDRGANPNAVSSARQTPLHYLAERAKSSPLESMRLLLDSGADLDAKGPVMWTALHLLSASEKPHLDAMMLLLTRGIDVNARDNNQWTALHFVAHYNQDPAAALKILVDAGADVNALTKRHEGVIQILLKSKSIDRLAAVDLTTFENTPSSSTANRNGLPAAASSGLAMLGQFGGHNRRMSTISTLSSGSSSNGQNLTRNSTVVDNNESLSSTQPELMNSGNIILTSEEEAKEETLKKLAELIRWLVVDCGVQLETTLEYDDPYPPAHPKNQHVLFQAIRLGMRPIVAVLLEISLVMSEAYVLDDALQLIEEMLSALNSAAHPHGQSQSQYSESDMATTRSSFESTCSSASTFLSRHRRDSVISNSASTVLSLSNSPQKKSINVNLSNGGGGSSGGSSSNAVTPKSIAIAAASISRIQEIGSLLKVWRFGEQREQLIDSVKARLARSNRRRRSGKGGRSSGDDDSSTAGGNSSPVSSMASEREILQRSTTM
ncbi:hypothetical protein BX616_003318 [Lobosporangium transversale]|nr:hypothetical protein BX616_003318 [Lobosporangium transversale]